MFKRMWVMSLVLVVMVCGPVFAENIVDGGNSTGADITIGTNDNYKLKLETYNTPRLTIDTSGNVGIGTTGPDRKLDILAAADPQLRLTQADGTKYGDFQIDSTGNLILTTNLGRLFSDGTQNLMIGTQVAGGTANDVGVNNVFLGYRAGYNNDYTTGNEGQYNVYIGSMAGYGATADTNNTGAFNVAVGHQSLYYNTNAQYNSAMGYKALYKNTTGGLNTAIGYSALAENLTGIRNCAVGAYTLNVNTDSYNSAIGTYALTANTSGSYNSAMGYGALFKNVSGGYNTALGSFVGYGVADNSFSNNSLFGYAAGYSLSTGSNNILIGYAAGNNLNTGANNIIIGYDIDAPSAAGNNQLSIGNLIFATGIDGTGTTISSGNVGIGTTNPQSKLAVNGTVTAKKVKVIETGWSDYVFNDDYKLASLEEVESYIKENKHLPGVPSASEVKTNGLVVSEMMKVQMAKIEELTLHVIELSKENKALSERISELEGKAEE